VVDAPAAEAKFGTYCPLTGVRVNLYDPYKTRMTPWTCVRWQQWYHHIHSVRASNLGGYDGTCTGIISINSDFSHISTAFGIRVRLRARWGIRPVHHPLCE
jgi:hypothetical protein